MGGEQRRVRPEQVVDGPIQGQIADRPGKVARQFLGLAFAFLPAGGDRDQRPRTDAERVERPAHGGVVALRAEQGELGHRVGRLRVVTGRRERRAPAQGRIAPPAAAVTPVGTVSGTRPAGRPVAVRAYRRTDGAAGGGLRPAPPHPILTGGMVPHGGPSCPRCGHTPQSRPGRLRRQGRRRRRSRVRRAFDGQGSGDTRP